MHVPCVLAASCVTGTYELPGMRLSDLLARLGASRRADPAVAWVEIFRRSPRGDRLEALARGPRGRLVLLQPMTPTRFSRRATPFTCAPASTC